MAYKKQQISPWSIYENFNTLEKKQQNTQNSTNAEVSGKVDRLILGKLSPSIYKHLKSDNKRLQTNLANQARHLASLRNYIDLQKEDLSCQSKKSSMFSIKSIKSGEISMNRIENLHYKVEDRNESQIYQNYNEGIQKANQLLLLKIIHQCVEQKKTKTNQPFKPSYNKKSIQLPKILESSKKRKNITYEDSCNDSDISSLLKKEDYFYIEGQAYQALHIQDIDSKKSIQKIVNQFGNRVLVDKKSNKKEKRQEVPQFPLYLSKKFKKSQKINGLLSELSTKDESFNDNKIHQKIEVAKHNSINKSHIKSINFIKLHTDKKVNQTQNAEQ